jgi:hypothetical protein
MNLIKWFNSGGRDRGMIKLLLWRSLLCVIEGEED